MLKLIVLVTEDFLETGKKHTKRSEKTTKIGAECCPPPLIVVATCRLLRDS